MAVLEGLGLPAFPVAGKGTVAPARRRVTAVPRAGHRRGRVGWVLATIAVAFLLAFVSLVQTMEVTATGYRLERLLADQAALRAQRDELLSDLNRLSAEPAIRKEAIDLGLSPLASPLVLPPR
jgi:hypothetical protein